MNPDLVAALAARLPPNDAPERPLMQLATIDAAGRPDVRSVLLTAWDNGGFLLNTDSASRKAAQIAAHAEVALCLVLPAGQVVVQGRAVPQTAQEERDAFARRSRYLQQLAWQNTAALAVAGADERRRAWADFSAANDGRALEPSATWTGFRVIPARVTFWTPDPDGPSHRVEHRLEPGGAWSTADLPG